MNKGLAILAFMLAASAEAGAQEQEQDAESTLTLDAQLRTRGEYRNGALQPRDEGGQAAMFLNERTRLTMQYDRGALSLRVMAQHTGVWGQDPLMNRQGRFDVGEAWVGMQFTKNIFGRLGRQPLVYDDERLLGASDWNVAGAFHDVALLGYKDDYHEVHGLAAFNQNSERTSGTYYDTSSGMPYKSMQMLWYHFTSDMLPLGVSLMAMNLGKESGSEYTGEGKTEYKQTLGAYVTFRPEQWDVEASLYYQMGKRGKPTSAWMASVRGGYGITPEWRVTAGYDYLSGQDDDDYGTTNHAFDPLFGTHHKFYGAMDYFFASPFGYKPRTLLHPEEMRYAPGLQDIQLGVVSKAIPVRGLVAQLNYHYFASAAKLSGSIRGLGHEVDLQASLPLIKDVTLQAGYSFMIGQNTMDIVKGGYYKSWQDWAWITFSVSPRLFSLKK